MRRKEKQVQERSAIESIIAKAEICHLAMSNNDHPYVVPLSFGYKDSLLYFHSAHEGKKLEMIAANPRVSFVMCIDNKVIKAEKACNWGTSYKSVIGFGKASFIEEPTEKIRALDKGVPRNTSPHRLSGGSGSPCPGAYIQPEGPCEGN